MNEYGNVGKEILSHCASFSKQDLYGDSGLFHLVAHMCLSSLSKVKYGFDWDNYMSK